MKKTKIVMIICSILFIIGFIIETFGNLSSDKKSKYFHMSSSFLLTLACIFGLILVKKKLKRNLYEFFKDDNDKILLNILFI